MTPPEPARYRRCPFGCCSRAEYFPAFLTAFAGDRSTDLAGRDARAVLALAFTPTAAARLSRTRIAAALRRAGRQRGVDELARRIQQASRQRQLHLFSVRSPDRSSYLAPGSAQAE